MHIIVIGAGIIGASIADQLTLAGARVSLIDQTGPAAGASGKSFGWINAAFADTPEYFRLRRAAMDHFRALSDNLDLSHAVTWSGCLWWEDEGEAFDTHTAGHTRFGYEAEVIDGAAFARLEPEFATPPERCVFSKVEGAAEADLVIAAMLNRAASNGADLLFGRKVTALTRQNDHVTGVMTDLGPLYADHVVCAAGPWTGSLLESCGVPLPLANKTGMIVHTTPTKAMIRHIIMSPDIHFRQTTNGNFVMGEIFSGGFQDGAMADASALAQDLMTRLRRKLPGCGDIACARINLGVRPVPADGFPVIGPVDTVQGLTIAVMHSGVTLGPFVGRLVADEILTATPDPLLEKFRHNRFAEPA